MPPLVQQFRKKVKEWRHSDEVGATDMSKNLLHWRCREHNTTRYMIDIVLCTMMADELCVNMIDY
jgi:hypothetical protein